MNKKLLRLTQPIFLCLNRFFKLILVLKIIINRSLSKAGNQVQRRAEHDPTFLHFQYQLTLQKPKSAENFYSPESRAGISLVCP